VNKRLFLSCTLFLILVSLAAAPAVAAMLPSTVDCPSSCSCLLPAEAAKINTPGLCGGKQMVCARDAKNEKYCYEKPVTTTTVPLIIVTGYQLFTTTPAAAPVPVPCPSGCSCYTLEDGKQNSLPLCGSSKTLCGYTPNKQPKYCHGTPVTVTTTATVPIEQPVYRVPVTITAAVPVTPVVPVSQVAVVNRCFISGNIYNFFHNTSTLKVQFTPEGGSPQDVSVSPVFAGDLVDHYSYSRIAACNGITEVRPVYRADPDVCPWVGTFTPSRSTTVTMTGESQSGWDFTYISADTHVPEAEVVFTPAQPAAGEGVRVTVWGKDDMSITRMSAKYDGVKTDGTSFSQPWSTLDPERALARKAGDLPGWSDSFDVNLPDISRLTVTARVCDGSGNERWGSGTVQSGSCNDNLKNRDEEQIDCGGSFCPACIRCTWCGAHVTPLRINGRTAEKIDVVFVPDNDYGGDMAQFARDVQDTLNNGYYQNDAIAQNRSKLNLYYLDDDADITAYPACGFTPPLGSCEDFQDATSFADSIAVVHKTDFRDWSGTRCERRVFASEPTSYRTFVHESGHSLFGLKDEYCCDSHYAEQDDLPNIWSSRENCRSDAASMGWDPDDCTNFCPAGTQNCGSGFWSIDPDVCIMECSQVCNRCGVNGMCQYEQACLRRVNDVFSQYS
jgi:hypothetical protein